MNCLPAGLRVYHRSFRAPIGRGRPAMRFGGLAWLPHRGSCCQGCTHTEGNRGRVVRLQRAVGSIKAGYVRKEHSFAAHAACGNAEQRRTEGCITQVRRTRTRATCTSNRAWLAPQMSMWVQSDPNSLKFRRNVPHFGQRAIDAQGIGNCFWPFRGRNNLAAIPVATNPIG